MSSSSLLKSTMSFSGGVMVIVGSSKEEDMASVPLYEAEVRVDAVLEMPVAYE
jgi:hypothetical protein